jgi:hypothetical protein
VLEPRACFEHCNSVAKRALLPNQGKAMTRKHCGSMTDPISSMTDLHSSMTDLVSSMTNLANRALVKIMQVCRMSDLASTS